MELQITQEDIESAKASAKRLLEYDIYKLCLLFGINPSTLDVTDGIIQWFPSLVEGDKDYIAEIQLRKLLDSYQKIM